MAGKLMVLFLAGKLIPGRPSPPPVPARPRGAGRGRGRGRRLPHNPGRVAGVCPRAAVCDGRVTWGHVCHVGSRRSRGSRGVTWITWGHVDHVGSRGVTWARGSRSHAADRSLLII